MVDVRWWRAGVSLPRDVLATVLSVVLSAVVFVAVSGCRGQVPDANGEPPAIPPQPTIVTAVSPLPEIAVERRRDAPAVDRYGVDLESDEFLHLVAEQKGLDLTIVIRDDRRLLLAIDSPGGAWGEEHLFFIAGQAGEYSIELQASGGNGAYVLYPPVRRSPTARDRLLAAAASAQGEGDRLRRTGGSKTEALAWYAEAIELWQRLGDSGREAMTLARRGQIHGQLGQRAEQRQSYEQALRQLGDQAYVGQRIFVLLALGSVHRQIAEPKAALLAFEEALRLSRAIGDRSEEATALNNMAILFELEGRLQESLALFQRVFDLYEAAGRRDWAAVALRNLAFAHVLAGQLAEARATVARALEYQSADNLRGRATGLLYLGWIDFLEEKPAAALELFAEALALARGAGDRAIEGGALDRQGSALRALGRIPEALAAYQEALAIFRQDGLALAAANVEANLGWAYLHDDDLERAEGLFASSLASFRRATDHHGAASTLHLGARIARRQGRLAEARRRIEEALRIVESHHMASSNRAVRVRYLSSRFEYYEHYIDLLMEFEARAPGRGHASAAVEAVERGRARSLLERLTRAGSRRAAPAPLGQARIRSDMLDEETLLLVYSLGRERSFVWAITSESVTSHVLAPAARIEELASRFHGSASRGPAPASRMQAELAAQALSDEILVPVASRLVRETIVVMAEGALHLVPFAALPKPDPVGQPGTTPLVAEHDVVYVPSASVTTSLRRSARPPGRGVGVLADPVFSLADPRLPTPVGSTRTSAAAPLARLIHSRREAEAIRTLLPKGTPHLEALGFDARRELIAGGELDGYAILHVATHGTLRAEHPERSGLVLSLFDRAGQPVDGALDVRQIYDLELSAELVVLSACRTALGQQFRGEGVVGLPRAFLYAGVPRVVVSLWEVDDEATAELMQRFYRGMLQAGSTPSVALREAQRALRAERRWQSPFYWAGFVLQGDWR